MVLGFLASDRHGCQITSVHANADSATADMGTQNEVSDLETFTSKGPLKVIMVSSMNRYKTKKCFHTHACLHLNVAILDRHYSVARFDRVTALKAEVFGTHIVVYVRINYEF